MDQYYSRGQKDAMTKLGLLNELKMLGRYMGAGFSGQGAVAKGLGATGVGGAAQMGGKYMKGLMRRKPGTAAGIIGGAGLAAGVGGSALMGGGGQR